MKVLLGVHSRQRKPIVHVVEDDLWNLDHTLSEIILCCLRKFKEKTYSYPNEFANHPDPMKAWKEALDKMICSFEYVQSNTWPRMTKADYKKFGEGMKLFSKFYSSLWI
jgi:hypothetical protein